MEEGLALPLCRAPAVEMVIAVITAADVEASAATSLDGILETTPVLQVGHAIFMNIAVSLSDV